MGKSFKRKIIIVDKDFQMRFTRKFVMITLLGTIASLMIILGFYYFTYKHGGKDLSRYLIEVGMDQINVDVRNAQNQTPLHLAAQKPENLKIATILLENGADVNAKDREGKTPLDYAITTGDPEMIELFLEYGGAEGEKP